MSKIKMLYRLLSDLSSGRILILLISAVLPILIMIAFCIFLAIKFGYVLELSLAMAVSTLAVTIPLYVLHRVANRSSKNIENTLQVEVPDELVKASSEWSQSELVIWNLSKTQTRALLKDNSEWANIDKAGFEILELVAEKFAKKTLDFSIPEGLKLFEEVGRRYKKVVKENIPAIEYLRFSYIKAGYDAYEKYGEVGKIIVNVALYANHAKNLYVNPLKAITDLSREQMSSSMTKGIVEDIQWKAKLALLDSLASVAIDLYSGRFSLEENEIQASNISEMDKQRNAADLEPIRIVIVGQTGAGKSTIINVLKEEFVAEVDVLPSTNVSTVYSAKVSDNDVKIIDLQGLDGQPKTANNMLDEMTQADVVLWVLKANQSARYLDKQLQTQFELFYADPKNVSRKKPTVIAVVNQVDKLKPIADWQPPYDLNNPMTAKAKIIAQALNYNHKLLSSDITLPLSVSENAVHFGVEMLKKTLVEQIPKAKNVQRSRQRNEAMSRGVGVKKQFGRAVNAGKKIVPHAIKSSRSKINEYGNKKNK